MKFVGILGLLGPLMACAVPGRQAFGPTPEQQQAMNDGCARQIGMARDAYCDKAPAKPPLGFADVGKQQRNGLAARCKDARSAEGIAALDSCLAVVASHE